ncbi:MAG: S1C family serine protease [Oscillospiraceae bacterium]
MYDYNSNGMNNGQNDTQYQGSFTTEPQPPKKPRTHKTAKVIALVAAVTVLCGGAGFGGAFIANQAGNMLIQGVYDKADNSSTAGSKPDTGSAPAETGRTEVLDALQSNTSVQSNITEGKTEYNSDGSYAYTRDLVSDVKDSIVYIEQYVSYYGKETLAGAGSGIVISQDGYIITNAHVVENSNYNVTGFKVKVTTTDPTDGSSVSNTFDAVLIGSDTDTDLAVLKIEAENLTAAKLGDSDKLCLGDDVVVIGNPLGLETSVTKGIVSGLNRQVYDDNVVSAIQTDTAINSGNSGGAMFNMFGEVVGVVNMKLINNNAENLSFAITINDAKPVINDLITKGYVTGRPILGITCIQVSDYLGAIQNMTPGLLVTSIQEGMAIADSDLVVGDTITAIDGTQVRTVDEVSNIIKDKKPGDKVTATVVRTDSRGRNTQVDIEIVLSEYSGS